MKSRRRVSIIEPVGGHCGMDYYDFGLAGGLAAAGVDVVLHTCDETPIPKASAFEVRHTYRRIYGHDPKLLRALRWLFGTCKALTATVAERRRVVHFHLFHVGWPEFANVLLARILLRKVVITAHDVESFVDSLEKARLRRWVYGMAHAVVAHNNVSRQELMDSVKVEPRRIRIIRHGNYLGLVPPLPPQAEARRLCGVPVDARVVLYFGQIKEGVKGLDVLLRAMPLVLAREPKAVLLIAGKPWKIGFEGYQKLIGELGIEKACVKHIRHIDAEEVGNFFGAADVVALPYRRIYQSGVILKAMTYARAVVVSDLPGFLETVTDRVTGYVFSSGDPESLAQCLCDALSDEGERLSIAEAGAKLVRELYDWGQAGRDTAELYEEL